MGRTAVLLLVLLLLLLSGWFVSLRETRSPYLVSKIPMVISDLADAHPVAFLRLWYSPATHSNYASLLPLPLPDQLLHGTISGIRVQIVREDGPDGPRQTRPSPYLLFDARHPPHEVFSPTLVSVQNTIYPEAELDYQLTAGAGKIGIGGTLEQGPAMKGGDLCAGEVC